MNPINALKTTRKVLKLMKKTKKVGEKLCPHCKILFKKQYDKKDWDVEDYCPECSLLINNILREWQEVLDDHNKRYNN